MYVDDFVVPWGKTRWCHLLSDANFEELHAFAEALGVERRWFMGDRYDMPLGKREAAIEAGAKPITWLEAGWMLTEYRRTKEFIGPKEARKRQAGRKPRGPRKSA